MTDGYGYVSILNVTNNIIIIYAFIFSDSKTIFNYSIILKLILDLIYKWVKY